MNKLYLVAPAKSRRQYYHLRHLKKIGARLMENPDQAEGVLVMGGDGTMLRAIRKFYSCEIPFIGLNFGHIGFLMNKPNASVLKEIAADKIDFVSVRLLCADLYDRFGKKLGREFAFNDFYFERASVSAANIRVVIDGVERISPLICDGVIAASAAGSTAYNASAGGVVLPISANSMVLTGISPYLFNFWRTSQLSGDSKVELAALDIDKRPIRFLADGVEIPNVAKAIIKYSAKKVKIGFAKSEKFREKVLNLQFQNNCK